MLGFQNRTLVLLTLFCLVHVVPGSFVADGNADSKSGNFTGTWVANGSRETMLFGDSREVALFKLSGHVNLKNEVGNESDYWSECIGLADTETGSNIRCTWTSIDGEKKIFLVLKGEGLSKGSGVTGDFIGGTGATEGLTGNLQFQWSSMSAHSVNDSTSIGGYAKELNGSYQLP